MVMFEIGQPEQSQSSVQVLQGQIDQDTRTPISVALILRPIPLTRKCSEQTLNAPPLHHCSGRQSLSLPSAVSHLALAAASGGRDERFMIATSEEDKDDP